MPLWPQRWLRFMAKAELYWWPATLILNAAGAFPVHRERGRRRGRPHGCAARAGGQCRRDVPRGDAPQEGAGQEAPGPREIGRGADRAGSGSAARSRGRRRHRPAARARPAEDRFRRADRRWTTCSQPATSVPRRRKRPSASWLASRISRRRCERPARGRRRLLRAPRLPRAAEVDPPQRGRRLHEHARPALAGRTAGCRPRRLGHALGADVPARGLRAVPVGTSVRGLDRRAARDPAGGRELARLPRREGARLRSGRLPRGCGAGVARRRARGDLRPRRLPARERPRHDPAARRAA